MGKPTKREVDVTWSHCECVKPENRLFVKCKYCSQSCWGGITRMKHHLACTNKNVAACSKVPDEVREMFKKMIEESKKAKEVCLDDGENSKKGTKLAKQKTMNEVLKDRDEVIEDICECIYGNALAFNLVKLGPIAADEKEILEVCRKEVMEWDKEVVLVAAVVLGLLSEGLGLGAGKLAEMGMLDRRVMVGHYYPLCPQPQLTIGLRQSVPMRIHRY